MNKKGIAVAGCLIADAIFTIDQYPQKGNLTWMYDPIAEAGGTANLLRDLARLDPTLPLKASGLVGADEKGQLILDKLSEFPNINVDNITKVGRSAVTYAMTERSSKQRTFFVDSGSLACFDECYINWSKMDADIFMLEYLLAIGKLDEKDEVYGTKAAKVLHDAQARGMRTAIDMISEETNRYQTVVVPALRYVNYCIINEVEAEGTTGISLSKDGQLIEENIWKALHKLKELGVSTWAAIHSPTGGYGLDCQSGEQVKVASLSLPEGYIKGTTGAGDAY